MLCGRIVESRKVEGSLDPEHLDTIGGQLVEVAERFGIVAPVVDHNELDVRVMRAANAPNAGLQQRSAVSSGNNHRNERRRWIEKQARLSRDRGLSPDLPVVKHRGDMEWCCWFYRRES